MLPSSHPPDFASALDHQACRRAIRTGSRTFYAASKLLPPSVRQAAYGLYAFCRLSDDAIDLEGGSLDALERLRLRLARACDGRPLPFAADRAMADLMRRFAIPRAIPEAFLEGLAWDAEGRGYETFEDLQAYAVRVAGTVGVMMTLLMGVRDPAALARACDLGVAMQLTNIARDVGEDARRERLYLPLSWLREAGIHAEGFLAEPQANAALKRVVARLLEEADALYRKARPGIGALPAACRPAILAAAEIYAEIGREVERGGHDSVSLRARVPARRKLQLLMKAMAAAPWLQEEAVRPPLSAAAFLVDEVARSRLRPAPAVGPLDALRRPFLRVLQIFERLERREQFGD
jgi:phytoene synthase